MDGGAHTLSSLQMVSTGIHGHNVDSEETLELKASEGLVWPRWQHGWMRTNPFKLTYPLSPLGHALGVALQKGTILVAF